MILFGVGRIIKVKHDKRAAIGIFRKI